MTGLTAVSLFAGVEGFGLALERCGIPVVASVEIDPDCRGVITRHFPDTKLFGDIRKVTGDDLRAAGFVPERGIVCGGFPCTDLSVAGRRGGLGEGTRSGLWWEMARLVAELRPRWVLAENVPGLLSAVCPDPAAAEPGPDDDGWWLSPEPAPAGRGACGGGCFPAHGGAMGLVLGSLADCGYGVAYRILDSRFFHVAQRRERVFIVGCLGDGAAPVEVLLEPESGAGNPAARGTTRTDVAGAAAGSAGGSGAVGTLGTTGPGGGWRVGADEAAAGQLVPVVANAITPGCHGRGTSGHPAEDGHLVIAPTITAGWGSNHGAPGHGGKDEAAIAVTAATLQGGGRRGYRIDAEGAAGGHLIPFDTAQITSAGNRSNPRPGDPTLNGSAGLHVADTAYALTARNDRSDREDNYVAYPVALRGREAGGQIEAGEPGDPAFTLRTPAGGGSYPMVAHALTSGGADASEDGTGRGAPPVTVTAATLTSGRATGDGVNDSGRRSEDDVNLVPMAFNPQTGGSEGRIGYGDKPTALQASQVTAVQHGTAVRRLTPKECERLMGLPDGWTEYTADGKQQSDSARYRQIGNAVVVPVVQWIVGRLVAVDERGEPA